MSRTHFRDGRLVLNGGVAGAPRGRRTGSGSRREQRTGRTTLDAVSSATPREVEGLVTLQTEPFLAAPFFSRDNIGAHPVMLRRAFGMPLLHQFGGGRGGGARKLAPTTTGTQTAPPGVLPHHAPTR